LKSSALASLTQPQAVVTPHPRSNSETSSTDSSAAPTGKSATTKKRVEKLSNFFGVQSGGGGKGTTKSKNDIKELKRLLYVMNKKMSVVSSMTSSVAGQDMDTSLSVQLGREETEKEVTKLKIVICGINNKSNYKFF
jgi:hypothetical protein